MEKLLVALGAFVITALAALITSRHRMSTLRSVGLWILGFLGLVAIVLFAQAVVFEWLGWNGTDKNDWFFILWWLVVLLWFALGARNLFLARSKTQ